LMGMNRGLGRWWWKGNSAKAAGAASGLAFGITIAIFGFWKALVIAAFTAVGLLLGVIIDGNDEIKGAIGRLLGLGEDTGEEDE